MQSAILKSYGQLHSGNDRQYPNQIKYLLEALLENDFPHNQYKALL